MVKKEKKKFLHDYFAKAGSIESFGIVISGIIGAFLVKIFGISIIWIAGGISFFLTFFLLIFAKENFVKRNAKIKSPFKDLRNQSLTSVKYVRNHPVLFLFLIASAFVWLAGAFSGPLSWISFLQQLDFPQYAFGYMWSAMGIVGIFAPLIALKFLKKGKERQFMIICSILTIISLAFIAFINTIVFALLILLASIFFTGMSMPVERTYFHKFVKSKLRATIGSVEGVLMGIIGVIGLPLAGLSADYLGARYTILLSALLMIPSVIIYLRINDRNT